LRLYLLLAVQEVEFRGVQLRAQTRHLVVDLEVNGLLGLHGDDQLVAGHVHVEPDLLPVQVSRDVMKLDANLHSENGKREGAIYESETSITTVTRPLFACQKHDFQSNQEVFDNIRKRIFSIDN